MDRKINKINIKIPQNFGGFLFEVILPLDSENKLENSVNFYLIIKLIYRNRH